MKSIPTIFERERVGRKFLAIDKPNEEALWVFAGEGVATVKWDGSACYFGEGGLYKRLKLKEGRAVPPGWLHHSFDPEQRSGHGWMPVGNGREDEYHREALGNSRILDVGKTYELVGPKVQGGERLYGLERHELWEHGVPLGGVPRTLDGLLEWLNSHYLEGVVWHHPDGRMAKIKRRDFGIPWPKQDEPGRRPFGAPDA